jgi:cell division protein FtsZ
MRAALDYKLLEENSIKGAKAALINVTGGENMPLGEVEDAIGMIEGEADDNADIIWGNVIKPEMRDEIKVTVIATGFDSQAHMMMPHSRPGEMPMAIGANTQSSFAPERNNDEDLNVPTFIRRQAD